MTIDNKAISISVDAKGIVYGALAIAFDNCVFHSAVIGVSEAVVLVGLNKEATRIVNEYVVAKKEAKNRDV